MESKPVNNLVFREIKYIEKLMMRTSYQFNETQFFFKFQYLIDFDGSFHGIPIQKEALKACRLHCRNVSLLLQGVVMECISCLN